MKRSTIAVTLAVALSLTSFVPSLAGAAAQGDATLKTQLTEEQVRDFLLDLPQSYYNENPELSAAVKDLLHIMDEEDDMQVIEKRLRALTSYKKWEAKHEASMSVDDSMSIESQEQWKRVDALAKKYYDYYKKNGKFPDQNEVASGVIGPEFANSITLGEGVVVLQEIGISMTESRLAARLATIGSIAFLDGPLPVADFIALVTGVVILGYEVSGLSWKSTEVVANINANEGYSYSQNAAASISTSAAVRTQINNNYIHFPAWRYFGAGGGVLVGTPFTFQAAVTRMDSGSDTFSATYVDAFNVAKASSFGSDPVHDSPHNYTRYPNNLPHWHPTIMLVRKAGHAFHP